MGFFGGSRDREDRATRADLLRMEQRLAKQSRSSGPTSRELAGKGMRMLGRGFNDMAKSQSQPQSRGRPRISQLPKRSDMDLLSTPNSGNLDRMKMSGLRGRDIRGRRTSR